MCALTPPLYDYNLYGMTRIRTGAIIFPLRSLQCKEGLQLAFETSLANIILRVVGTAKLVAVCVFACRYVHGRTREFVQWDRALLFKYIIQCRLSSAFQCALLMSKCNLERVSLSVCISAASL